MSMHLNDPVIELSEESIEQGIEAGFLRLVCELTPEGKAALEHMLSPKEFASEAIQECYL